MKKLLALFVVLISYTTIYAQQPSIGHFQQLATVKRGDTLDVAWYYQPVASKDVRTFQVDFQYKKRLLTHIETTVDVAFATQTPYIDYKQFDNFKYSNYSAGNYNYTQDTAWTTARNYLILASGNQIGSNAYVIHNRYKINSVEANFASDSITINWARLFTQDGLTIGDNVANLTNKNLAIFLKGNLTISGKVWLAANMTSKPTVLAIDPITGIVASSKAVANDGTYTLDNIDENTRYKLDVKFPSPLATIRDNAVTIADAVKTYDEYTVTDVNQVFSRQYLKNGLAYLIADVNKTGTLDGGDPYSIYASVSGLKPIDTTQLINVFTKNTYDSLALGVNQWNDWSGYINGVTYIFDSVGTVNLTGVDIKYFILGDVDRTHSSPVYDAGGALVARPNYIGNLNVSIPNVTAPTGQAMYANFNINTNGIKNDGLQFEMRYDPTKVKFEEMISNIQGPWLQYLTHDDANGIIRFGGMNNQVLGSLVGNVTPFRLKFSPIGTNDIMTNVYVRSLMDAADKNGDHFNINLQSDYVVLTTRQSLAPTYDGEITATIRPNPTSGMFELVVVFPKENMTSLATVYDIQGRKIKDIGRLVSDQYVTTVVKQVDLTSAANGRYLLVLDNENQKRLAKQFVKI